MKKLAFVIGIIFIVGVVLLNIQYNQAVDQCVAGGHEINYCKEGLR